MQRFTDEAGQVMSLATFDRITGGLYRSNPQKKTLNTFACLAGVSKDRVYKAAGRPYSDFKFADQVSSDLEQLTENRWDVVLWTARALLKNTRELERVHYDTDGDELVGQSSNVVSGKLATEDVAPEQEVPGLDALTSHQEIPLQAHRGERFNDDLSEESKGGGKENE